MSMLWIKIPLCMISFLCCYEVIHKDRAWFGIIQIAVVALIMAL